MLEKLSMCIVLGLVGCSPTVRHSFLSTIFDGVPPLDTVQIIAVIDSSQIVSSEVLASNAIELRSKPEFVVHPPYLEKKCKNCHDQNKMGAFTQSQPGLCFQCHDNIEQQHEFSHGPAAGGFCTSCHSPHKSELENLLLRSEQQLCLDCHNSGIISNNEIHKDIGETNCTACHNPHSSNNQFMLREGACAKCHEVFNESSSHVHGPVEAGLCTSCHGSHTSESEKLLVSFQEQICFNCHDMIKVDKNNIHTTVKDSNCIECHSPHSTNNQFMLLDGVCTKCHEDLNESYSYIHGAVALQNIEVHKSKLDDQSCFSCHTSESIYSIEPHKNYKDTECLRCHNLH